MMYLGLILFILTFVVIAPKSQVFLLGLATSAGAWMSAWAPFSYVLLMILLVSPFVGIYLLRTWPERVEEESPMAKYLRESPVDQDED